ncbi:MAG TPA: hypothetical protein PLO44_00895 [Candidatus Paceibacterota bacterium]|nr:hypothetical protein [Candidatus Paceibacterota bacterium]
MENLFNFNKKKIDAGRQLNLNFTDLEKDKDGKTIYDFLEKAGIKEGDEDYKKILNNLSFRNGYFYVGDVYIKEYLYWKKVYSEDKKKLSDSSDKFGVKKVPKKKINRHLSDKERDFLYGHWD